MTISLPSSAELSSLNPEYNRDPHEKLDRLRSECPVRRDEQFGEFLLSGYHNVRAVLSDNSLWRNPERAEDAAIFAKILLNPPAGVRYPNHRSMIFLDDPDHARVRGAVGGALRARFPRVEPIIRQAVVQTLDAIGSSGAFDLIRDFAVPIPVLTIAGILGIDPSRIDEFRMWSEDVIRTLDPLRTPEQAVRVAAADNAITEYVEQLVAARRTSPRDDLLTDLAACEARGEISMAEISVNCTALLVAGNITTTDLISNAVYLLLAHPAERAKLAENPELIGAAIEEVLRFEPPVARTARIASRELQVGECPVKPHQSMALLLMGANHDPEVFENPHRFDITRPHVPHVAFGGGAHVCVGAPLARMEARIAVPAFFERFPWARLGDEPLKWSPIAGLRGLEELRISRRG